MGQVMFLLLALGCLFSYGSAEEDVNKRCFPKGFKLGVANAAPQIESAWNEDGKGESIWDRFAFDHPEKILDHTAPANSSRSYYKWREDLEMIKEMGMDHYKLSIAWTRIYPDGYKTTPNAKGVQYYKNVLHALHLLDIEPIVVLYHWDLPQKLQDDFEGWLSPNITDVFADYARTCFELFGDQVKHWITINEPRQVCRSGYGDGQYAPGIHNPGVGDYICAKNVLLAHAKAYHIYDKEFREKQQGKVSIAIDTEWFEPNTDSQADKEASERALQFYFGLYANPVYLGDWPTVVKERVAQRSKQEGLKESRLPSLNQEEIDLIKGTHDFMALQHYASHKVKATKERPIGVPSFFNDLSVNEFLPKEWPRGGEAWFAVWAPGMRKLLVWLKSTYNNPEILITENGVSDNTGTLEDYHRINYYRDYLSSVLDAIYIDNVNVTRYTAWTFLDDWEWTSGFKSKIGMYSVDFEDIFRTRTPRKSAEYMTEICRKRCLVDTKDYIH